MHKFFSFDGIDGAGKGVQVALLRDHLIASGHAVTTTREPGGPPAAERIREALLSGQFQHLGPIAEVMMFNAARSHHLNETIRPALARGEVVISDRFHDSTLAYQGAGDHVDRDWIKTIQAAVVGDTLPDITFILDVPVDISFERMKHRGAAADRFEATGRDYFERLRQAYLTIAAENPDRCKVVDATQPIDTVHKTIVAQVQAIFS